jgi:prepilin-type N-terminal cleavage/methylation domain-containing protein
MKRKAFSLIEIIIVLFVISCMAALSYPILHPRLEKVKVKHEAQQIIKEIHQTKINAMQSGEEKTYCYEEDCIKYYPDGSTINATIKYKSLLIKVNGLTGVATINF